MAISISEVSFSDSGYVVEDVYVNIGSGNFSVAAGDIIFATMTGWQYYGDPSISYGGLYSNGDTTWATGGAKYTVNYQDGVNWAVNAYWVATSASSTANINAFSESNGTAWYVGIDKMIVVKITGAATTGTPLIHRNYQSLNGLGSVSTSGTVTTTNSSLLFTGWTTVNTPNINYKGNSSEVGAQPLALTGYRWGAVRVPFTSTATTKGAYFASYDSGYHDWQITQTEILEPSATPPQTVSPSGIASTVAFGTAKISRTVPTTGIASTVAFGTAVVSVASTTKTLSPSGIASTVAFGTAQLNRTVPTEGIASSNAFGTAQLNQTLTTTGIASTVAFGTASVLPSQIVTTTGIASTTTFGTPQVNLSLSATGISSTTSFGTAKLNLGISLTGIASTNAFGTAQLTVFVPVTGIPSTTTFGVAQVNLGVTTVGIGSTSALGSPQLNLTIVDVGAIASTIVFGTAEVGGTVPNLVGRRSSVAGSAGRTSATGATGRTTLV